MPRLDREQQNQQQLRITFRINENLATTLVKLARICKNLYILYDIVSNLYPLFTDGLNALREIKEDIMFIFNLLKQ